MRLASIACQPETELRSALDRLIAAGLVFRQGQPPHSTYLFKHALVQDAAYGTLLREPRRALHARIVEALESQFPEIAETQPELLARHCTEAGMSEKAAGMWGKAGQLSLERSALIEAAQQFTRPLDLIAALPATSALRREQIKFQVALINPLVHIKGYGAPEVKAAAERAQLLIERAQALGEQIEDPLLLFSVLYGLWIVKLLGFDGDALRELAAQFLALAMKQAAAAPLMVGHRLMAVSLASTGDVAQGRAHSDQALPLYNPVEHRALATRFGADSKVSILGLRSLILWFLGYPEAALADSGRAVSDARESGQAPALMFALYHTGLTHAFCANLTKALLQSNELITLADEKGALFWKTAGMLVEGLVLVLTGRLSLMNCSSNAASCSRLSSKQNGGPARADPQTRRACRWRIRRPATVPA